MFSYYASHNIRVKFSKFFGFQLRYYIVPSHCYLKPETTVSLPAVCLSYSYCVFQIADQCDDQMRNDGVWESKKLTLRNSFD